MITAKTPSGEVLWLSPEDISELSVDQETRLTRIKMKDGTIHLVENKAKDLAFDIREARRTSRNLERMRRE